MCEVCKEGINSMAKFVGRQRKNPVTRDCYCPGSHPSTPFGLAFLR